MQVQRPLTSFWRIANGQEVFGIADEKKMTVYDRSIFNIYNNNNNSYYGIGSSINIINC